MTEYVIDLPEQPSGLVGPFGSVSAAEAYADSTLGEVRWKVRELYQPEKRREERKPCKGFQWVGQSFECCDGCGEPYWEHTHDTVLKKGAGPFDDESPFALGGKNT